MRLSMGARIALVVLAAFVGVAALLMFFEEREYGGQDAIEGLAKGYLLDDMVEVRQVDWGLAAEAASDYELTVEADQAVIRLVDGGGRVLFTGTLYEADTWLNEQGPQRYLGSRSGADAYLANLRDGAKNYATAITMTIVAIGLVLIAVIPSPADRPTTRSTGRMVPTG